MFLQSAFSNMLSLIFWIPLRVLRVEACARKWWPSPELLEDDLTLIARMMTTRMLFGALLGIPIGIVLCAAGHLFKQRQYIAKGTITAVYIGREREGRRVRGELLQHLKKHGLEGLETVLELDNEEPFSYRQVLKFTTRATRILYRDSFSFFRQFFSLIYIAIIFALFIFVSRVPGAASVPLGSLDPLYGELPYTWDKGNRELLGVVLTMVIGGSKLELFHLLLTAWTQHPEQVRDSARSIYSKLGEEWGKLVGGAMTRNDIRDILQRSTDHGGYLASVAVIERLVAEIQNLQGLEESSENSMKEV